MIEPYKVLVPAIVTFLLQGAAFWAYLLKRRKAVDVRTQLLLGLVQSEIRERGMKYIERGYVTYDELEDLELYFYKPYVEAGGNGTAERIMHQVQRLDTRRELSPIAALTETTTIRSTDRTGDDNA